MYPDRTIAKLMVTVLTALSLSACSVIDDDLSDCREGENFEMDYQLKLVTNMTTELKTQLTTITEMSVASALETHLKDIFSDFAHDVDLSFYDTDEEQERLEHVQDIINANQTSYTLTLPMRMYMHLAVANIKNNPVVALQDDEKSNTSKLQQADGETITSHTTGLFTARLPMEVLEGVDQTFNVRLYMANSAAALVVDPHGVDYRDMKVYVTGFANSFCINDSVYSYPDKPVLVKADRVDAGNDLLCFCSVNFPSRDAAPAKAPRRAADESLWQCKVYVTKTDGSVTETLFDIAEPLKAGDLRVIKCQLNDDGSVTPTGSVVGVSITLNWNDGGNYNSEL